MPDSDVEVAVYTKDILKVLGWSPRKFARRRWELEQHGILFYRLQGFPPKRRLCAFPSDLRAWIRAKAKKGEYV